MSGVGAEVVTDSIVSKKSITHYITRVKEILDTKGNPFYNSVSVPSLAKHCL